MTHTASQVYFGMNPMWVATCLLLVTYAFRSVGTRH